MFGRPQTTERAVVVPGNQVDDFYRAVFASVQGMSALELSTVQRTPDDASIVEWIDSLMQ